MNTILKDYREAFDNDDKGLLKSEQLALLEYAEHLEKQAEMMHILLKEQGMQLNLLRIKYGEYTLVEKRSE